MIASATRNLSFLTILPVSQRSPLTAVGQLTDANHMAIADSTISRRAHLEMPSGHLWGARQLSSSAKYAPTTGHSSRAEHSLRPAIVHLTSVQNTPSGHSFRHASECLTSVHAQRAWRHFKARPGPTRLRVMTSLPCTLLIGHARAALSRQSSSADQTILRASHPTAAFRSSIKCLPAIYWSNP